MNWIRLPFLTKEAFQVSGVQDTHGAYIKNNRTDQTVKQKLLSKMGRFRLMSWTMRSHDARN